MSIKIVPLSEQHFEQLYEVFCGVVAEKKFLAWVTAPPKQEAFSYYRSLMKESQSAFVACEGEKVLGHCDIQPASGDARSHVGHIGLYLAPHARNQGIGRKLMTTTISDAFDRGLTRIELTVRIDNTNAIVLYERLGFEMEGTNRNVFLIDGHYYDGFTMALLKGNDV